MTKETKSMVTTMYVEWQLTTKTLNPKSSFYDYCEARNLFDNILIPKEEVEELKQYVREISDNA